MSQGKLSALLFYCLAPHSPKLSAAAVGCSNSMQMCTSADLLLWLQGYAFALGTALEQNLLGGTLSPWELKINRKSATSCPLERGCWGTFFIAPQNLQGSWAQLPTGLARPITILMDFSSLLVFLSLFFTLLSGITFSINYLHPNSCLRLNFQNNSKWCLPNILKVETPWEQSDQLARSLQLILHYSIKWKRRSVYLNKYPLGYLNELMALYLVFTQWEPDYCSH